MIIVAENLISNIANCTRVSKEVRNFFDDQHKNVLKSTKFLTCKVWPNAKNIFVIFMQLINVPARKHISREKNVLDEFFLLAA